MRPGTLFVVATPIGNLEDITLRALRVLHEADVIAAEDTRRTAKLLAHHGISTPTISFHEHNVRTRLPQLMARLADGAAIAVVSDAGTPGLSDPGLELVQACRHAGVAIDPIPGPSAPLTAAMAAGFPLVPLSILGFAPARSSDRSRWLSEVSSIDHTCVFFEAPTRMAKMLSDASAVMGDRPIIVARELTKVHQEFLAGTVEEVRGRFGEARGEFTVVLGPWRRPRVHQAAPTDAEVAAEFWRITNGGAGSRRQAIALTARRFEMSPKDVYIAIEKTKRTL